MVCHIPAIKICLLVASSWMVLILCFVRKGGAEGINLKK